jgi:LCP family protein required for cell wall assembly
MTSVPERAWGPTAVGGRRRRRPLVVLAVVAAALAAGLVTAAFSLYRVADRNIERVHLPALAQKVDTDPLNVLVVGSDSREGLTDEEVRRYSLGTSEGQRGDSVILVSITADRSDVRTVSFPRDLLVADGGEQRKLNETFAGGPDQVVDVLQRTTGIPIHHYVEVSIPGFIKLVEAVDGVEICLEKGLQDDKSGADFAAGCHDMTPEEALSYVRSRNTPLGDFDRMARQQTFMRALLDRLVATRTLVDLPRLFEVVERLSRNVTTDAALGVGEMRALAAELRQLAAGDVPMVTAPAYAATLDGKEYVVPYEVGTDALYAALRAGEPLEARGTLAERRSTEVVVWSGGRDAAADVVQRTLYWSAFSVGDVEEGPVDAGATTVVHAAPGHEERAGWVAATLGTRVEPLPAGVTLPDGVDAAVAVGEDAG